ncbi:hypothetical protein SAMN05421770_107205 [Granulicella rosea]|uniref:Uncharacterized protein n=1 Tax=Granulicella rosea TaxID=474952 RepID=A0A239LQV3_9BACT|nr:hypothetical protein SAMN05421770_107205 [Granulicella rosea]
MRLHGGVSPYLAPQTKTPCLGQETWGVRVIRNRFLAYLSIFRLIVKLFLLSNELMDLLPLFLPPSSAHSS